MRKVLSINRNTGIQRRSSVLEQDDALINQEDAPTITELHQVFVDDGVPLAIKAARKALQEARLDMSQITHVVCTTNTDSGTPGLDHLLEAGLGIDSAEKILLHGVSPLAALRTAANLALGYTAMAKAARILCVALDVNTTIVRSELDSVHELQEARIGACLFSDCASAVVLSNGLGEPTSPVYELLRWNQKMIRDTENDYGFDVHETGWKPRLSHRLPNILNQALGPGFKDLIGIPQLHGDQPHPASFDWAMDPFGGPVLASAEDALDITAEHLRASYDTYNKHGHSGSAALFSVLDRLRSKDMDTITAQGKARDYIIGCSFGPGIVLDMCMLRKYGGNSRKGSGAPQLQSRTGSETSAASTSEGYSESPTSGTHMADALKSLDLDHME